MKKIMIAALAALPVFLTACATAPGQTGAATGGTVGAATTIGVNIFKAAVDNQCRAELNANQAWRVFALTQTAEKQAELEGKICGCVSEKAPQSVTAVELAQAAIDPNARTQIVANTISKTLNACYSEFAKK